MPGPYVFYVISVAPSPVSFCPACTASCASFACRVGRVCDPPRTPRSLWRRTSRSRRRQHRRRRWRYYSWRDMYNEVGVGSGFHVRVGVGVGIRVGVAAIVLRLALRAASISERRSTKERERVTSQETKLSTPLRKYKRVTKSRDKVIPACDICSQWYSGG